MENMGSEENSIEMDQMKVEEEKEPLKGDKGDAVSLANGNEYGTNGVAAIEIDETKNTDSKGNADESLESEFYRIIFAILIPYILIGCPFNYCFAKTSQHVHKFSKLATSWCMKVMRKWSAIRAIHLR